MKGKAKRGGERGGETKDQVAARDNCCSNKKFTITGITYVNLLRSNVSLIS